MILHVPVDTYLMAMSKLPFSLAIRVDGSFGECWLHLKRCIVKQDKTLGIHFYMYLASISKTSMQLSLLFEIGEYHI